ncbi:MAG: efflux RND transporter periplasmic adaptor subunit [Bacteroidales bacterium]|nr:efflux RND transporter periplasmic adaptor subunit [Candidatus Physcousia equi]
MMRNDTKGLKKFWRAGMVLAAVSGMMLVSCSSHQSKAEAPLATVRIDTVKSSGVAAVQQYPGRVVAASDANVSFKVAGVIQDVAVKEGQHVRKGQLLATLDASDYQVQLKATQAEYAQIKAEAERVIGLYGEGGTTASNYDKARYGLEQIEAKLQNHRNQLSYTRIYAPYDGYVQKIYMKRGEAVSAGLPIVGMLSSGAPDVEINLPASAYVNRANFVSYECTFDVLPNQVLMAKPVSVLSQANSNQLYTMRLKLLENNETVSPGMSTWVTIKGLEHGDGLVRVPNTSIVNHNKKNYAFIYDASKQTVYQVEVELHDIHTDGTVDVCGKIQAGDLIVTSGVHHIEDGAKVNRLEPVSETNVGGLM